MDVDGETEVMKQGDGKPAMGGNGRNSHKGKIKTRGIPKSQTRAKSKTHWACCQYTINAHACASCSKRKPVPRVACMAVVKENLNSLAASESSVNDVIMVNKQLVGGIYDSGFSLGATIYQELVSPDQLKVASEDIQCAFKTGDIL